MQANTRQSVADNSCWRITRSEMRANLALVKPPSLRHGVPSRRRAQSPRSGTGEVRAALSLPAPDNTHRGGWESISAERGEDLRVEPCIPCKAGVDVRGEIMVPADLSQKLGNQPGRTAKSFDLPLTAQRMMILRFRLWRSI